MATQLHHRTVTANGRRFHVVEAGSGPMVLLAHGFPESWYSWRHQLTALAQAGYRAVAPDMRGYGRSEKPPRIDDYRITELVADLVGIVDALGAGTAAVVGHDWGAPIAWTAAWTRPDVFTRVVGVSVPFGGRGLMAFPTSPFGELRPSVVNRAISGDDQLLYQDYFTLVPGNAEREFERDIRGWVEAMLYSFSGAAPAPPELASLDFDSLNDEELLLVLRRSSICFPRGTEWREKFVPAPEGQRPTWYTQEDVDYYTSELEHSGVTGGLNYYRCMDLNWELLGAWEGRPLEVPAVFIGGELDLVTKWASTALRAFPDHAPQARKPVIIPDCGHWVQQEKADEFNEALLVFLADSQ